MEKISKVDQVEKASLDTKNSIKSSNPSSNNAYIPPSHNVLELSDNQAAIHIMFYDSIEILSKSLINAEVYFRLSSFRMLEQDDSSLMIEDETKGFGEEYPIEIAVMNEEEHLFHAQQPNGRLLRKEEYFILRSRIPLATEIGMRVELYQKKKNQSDKEKLEFDKIAFGYIFPLDVSESNGRFIVPVTSKSGKIVARFKAEYFLAKYFAIPMELIKVKSKIRSPKSWQLKKGLDIGHRGAGCARRIDSSEKVLENTIDSFNFAYAKGADMVELDVQLSKDKIPIVFHDFSVNLVLQEKNQETEMEMNVKDLTFEQLQKLKFKPKRKGKEHYDLYDDENKPHGKPFASLKAVLSSVAPDCGFNVEIKYPIRQVVGDWISERSHDLNEYVDLILTDLFLYAEERHIVISSFHPGICSMVRLKQQRYPVLFLTETGSQCRSRYETRLNESIHMASYFALCLNLYGVAVHARAIINNPSLIHYVKSKTLVLFCYGDDLNNRDLIEFLKKEGIDGAIYDKIDLLSNKKQGGEVSNNDPNIQNIQN